MAVIKYFLSNSKSISLLYEVLLISSVVKVPSLFSNIILSNGILLFTLILAVTIFCQSEVVPVK